MNSSWLAGIRVVTMALNLPGPVACARLRDMGATVLKVEPPDGDPFEAYCAGWYARLHQGVEVLRIDLKSPAGISRMHAALDEADVFVTAQRLFALARLGLDFASVHAAHPRLVQAAITGHSAPREEEPGHDLTYLAAHGLVRPPELPPTLFADMAGAERAVSTTLALLLARQRTGEGSMAIVPLEAAAHALAQPLREGLTSPGALLGGGLAGYNLYAARSGWIAVAVLEPHFAHCLMQSLELAELSVDSLRQRFAARDAKEWAQWARERDLPIVALPD